MNIHITAACLQLARDYHAHRQHFDQFDKANQHTDALTVHRGPMTWTAHQIAQEICSAILAQH